MGTPNQMPISFHAGYHWDDPSLKTVNRFLGMHALGFAWPNIVHCTNWVLNGIPERFPELLRDTSGTEALLRRFVTHVFGGGGR